MRYLFDALIFGFLILTPLCIAWGVKFLPEKMWLSARILLVFSWLVIAYGSFIEPQIIVTNYQNISIVDERKVANVATAPGHNIKIALVSDIHVGPYKKTRFVERLVAKIMAKEPDIILLAGDFLYDGADYTGYLEPLAKLSAPQGVFAVMGNHDYGVNLDGSQFVERAFALELEAKLRELNIELLKNSGTVIVKGGGKFALLGVDEALTGNASTKQALASINEDVSAYKKILLAHNPDIMLSMDADVDLVLTGHTHGGQIRLPLIGAVPPLPQALDHKYDRGLFDYNGTPLFITSGVGEMGPRARLLAPPEVVIINLQY